MNLPDLRKQIDLIDAQLIALLNQRWALAPQVIEAKASTDIQVLDEDREQQVIEALQKASPKTPEETIELLWKTIMEESRRRQSESKFQV